MKYSPPVGSTEQNASYVDGNPATGIEGSAVPAAAIEQPQREIENLIKAALGDDAPESDDLTQLAQAVAALIAAHAALQDAHPAAKVSFDNTTAILANNPNQVQTALQNLANQSIYQTVMGTPLASGVSTTYTQLTDTGLNITVNKKRSSNAVLLVCMGTGQSIANVNNSLGQLTLQIMHYLAGTWVGVGGSFSIGSQEVANSQTWNQVVGMFCILHVTTSGQAVDQFKLQFKMESSSYSVSVYGGARFFALEIGQ